MMKSTSQLVKSIIITSPIYRQDVISRKIAELFNLKLIDTKELEKNLSYVEDLAPIVLKELDRNSCRSWLLDGFPRTKDEAEQLWKEQKCHIALNLKFPVNLLVAQANRKRLLHPDSGRVYSMEFSPPLRKGRDDETGDELIDYVPFSIPELRDKYLEFDDQIKPILDFFREEGILQEIHGNSTADLINKARICLSSVLPDRLL